MSHPFPPSPVAVKHTPQTQEKPHIQKYRRPKPKKNPIFKNIANKLGVSKEPWTRNSDLKMTAGSWAVGGANTSNKAGNINCNMAIIAEA